MTQIIFARHGIYQNPNEIIPFRSNDFHLSSEGKEQIIKNSQQLQNFKLQKIFSSPIQRCRETTEIYNKNLHISFEYDDRLIEIGSPYQGYTMENFSEMKHGKSLYGDPFHLQNGGETADQVVSRLENFMKERLNDKSDVLVVSHGDPIMLYIAKLQNITLDFSKRLEVQLEYIPMGGLLELDFEEDRFVNLKKLNY